MKEMEIERVSNGWVIKIHKCYTQETKVVLTENELLTEVYRAMCPWNAGAVVEVRP